MSRPLALMLALLGSAALAGAALPPKARQGAAAPSSPTPSMRPQLPSDAGSPFLKAGQVWRLTSPVVASAEIIVADVQSVNSSIQVSQRKFGGLGVLTDEVLAINGSAQGGASLTLLQMGVIDQKATSRWCVIEKAHNRLNEPQIGLFQEGSMNDAFEAAQEQWRQSGVRPDHPTCTLTRVK
ncbi:hypothetical protein [Deinococcus knuensis]|nr:hypothetical protein [Deinococcus knuensis]